MLALWNRTDHYIFALWFLSFFFFFFFFSSPNLSRRRLDICHTSTHGVALVRLKCTASGSLEMKSSKNRRLGTIAQLCWAISSQLMHISTIGKNIKQQYLLHISAQYGELQSSGWDRSLVWDTPQLISTAFASWLRYCSDVAQRKPTKFCTMFGR